MRFNNYLLENKKWAYHSVIGQDNIPINIELINDIKKNCSEILNLYKKNDNFLYRGIHSIDFIELKTPRTDRKPVSTPPEIHRFLDKEFYDLYGWKARSEAVFAINNKMTAGLYGNEYIVLPFNGYKFLYNKDVEDLLAWSKASKGLGTLDEYTYDEIVQNITKNKILENYTNKNLEYLLKTKRTIELMFKCSKYYLIKFIDWQWFK